MDKGLTGFESAVAGALDELGVGLLGHPREFTGAVADLYDPDSPELTVLYAHCSDGLLRPFAEAAGECTTAALEQAARKSELWLHDARRVVAEDAHVVAWGMARGVAAHLGIGQPCDPDADRAGEDDEARAAADRARAVLADVGATEADVADALAAVRELPEGAQGRATLESALEGRLAKLVAERDAEEERLRREREERERVEAARRRREERDRLLAEREARRKAAAHGGTVPGPESKPDPLPNNRAVAAAIAVVACVVVAIVLVANSHSMTQTKASGPNSVAAEVKTRADEGSVSGVEVRKGIAKYSWEELKELSQAIAVADSDKEGLKIAKEYHLVDSDGKLRGDTKGVKLTDGTNTSVRILGFRHDELADGGRAGISFEFADVPAKHRMNAKDTNSGGWEASEMREWLNSDFLALLPDDLRGCVEPAKKRTNNMGFVENGSDTSVVTVTIEQLWLLSSSEVYGKCSGGGHCPVYNAEDMQCQLYADHGVTMSDYSFCQKAGVYKWWWLRSPNAAQEVNFGGIFDTGYLNNFESDVAAGVSPGFCL